MQGGQHQGNVFGLRNLIGPATGMVQCFLEFADGSTKPRHREDGRGDCAKKPTVGAGAPS